MYSITFCDVISLTIFDTQVNEEVFSPDNIGRLCTIISSRASTYTGEYELKFAESSFFIDFANYIHFV